MKSCASFSARKPLVNHAQSFAAQGIEMDLLGELGDADLKELGVALLGHRKRLLSAIHIRFGLPPVLADEIAQQIKAADRGAAYLEATRLAGFAEAEARRLFGRDPGLPPATQQDYLTPWSAAKAEKRILARFKTLHA